MIYADLGTCVQTEALLTPIADWGVELSCEALQIAACAVQGVELG
jgi:hypothetical protein